MSNKRQPTNTIPYAIAVLKRFPMGTRCSWFGHEMWGGNRKPQEYARPAGKILRRLEAMGFVEPTQIDGHPGYRLTKKGLTP